MSDSKNDDPVQDFLPERQSPLLAALTRRELLRRAGLGGAALTVPGLLAACGGSDETAAETTGTGTTAPEPAATEIEELTWATTAIRALDYARGFDVSTGVPLAISLESLLIYDEDLQLQPLLAESWSQPDPLTYVFTLRPNVQFWDGTPMTADDVVFSLERHLDPELASEMGFYFETVESIEATGDSEVTVRMKSPDPFFAYVQTFTTIIPRAFAEAQGDRLGAPGSPVTIMGTGPYEITAFRADDVIEMVRNENYWGEPPIAQRVNAKIFADPQTMQLAMRAGQIDGTFQVPLPQAAQWAEIDGAEAIYAQGLGMIALYFRMTEEPWSDIHVRKTFAHAIDREGIIRTVLGGRAELANAVVPPAQWGGLLPPEDVEALYDELPSYEFDLELAKEELAQSSVPDGFSATVEYPNILSEVGRALLNLQENLRELNIDLTVNEVTPPQWFANLEERKFAFGISAFGPDYADPANYPRIVFSPGSDSNRADYENADVTRLLEEQQTATDPADRGEAIAEILRTTTADLPYLNLWWPESAMAINQELSYEKFSPLWYNQVWIRQFSA